MTNAPSTPSRARIVTANGQQLAVTEYRADADADRPPLLLLHGIGSRGASWWPVIDLLAVHCTLFVPDLRGHGASSKPDAGYLWADYAADLAGLITALALDRPRIIGHSLGGLISLTWATAHPDGATALVLEDTALRTVPESLAAFDGWLQLATGTVEAAAAHYRQENPHWTEEDCLRRAESVTLTAPAVFTELRADSAANLTAPRLDRLAPLSVVTIPTLLVYGEPAAGSMVHPDDAARLLTLLPAAHAVRVPGAGHSIHREHADAFVRLVMPFLRGVRTEG